MAARFMSKRPPTLESTIGVFLVALGALLRGSSGSCARPVVLPGRERRADTGPRGGWTVCGARRAHGAEGAILPPGGRDFYGAPAGLYDMKTR